MSREAKDRFVEIVEQYFETIEVEADVRDYFEDFKKCHSSNRKEMTLKGAKILEVLKKDTDKAMTAAEIGEELFIPGRSVSGSIRKLRTDGYVDAIENVSPKKYIVTEAGIAFDHTPYLVDEKNEAE